MSAITPTGEIASITKATVDIKVIKVNNRQMTKAIYNQLPSFSTEYIYSLWNGEHTDTSDMSIWGYVLECPKSCGQPDRNSPPPSIETLPRVYEHFQVNRMLSLHTHLIISIYGKLGTVTIKWIPTHPRTYHEQCQSFGNCSEIAQPSPVDQLGKDFINYLGMTQLYIMG